MDDQGFVYFRGRIKRMIVTSGYNVYPAQLENILDAHEKVQMSCIIGVPDPYKMQKVKAFVMLRMNPHRRPRTSCWPTAASTLPSTPCPMTSNSATSCLRPLSAR